MKKINLNEEEYKFSRDDMPILIHGEDHAGASFYTLSLIANLSLEGQKVLVLCGYPMAQEQFEKQVEGFGHSTVFYTKEGEQDFLHALASTNDNDIILIKNIELFDGSIIEPVLNKKNFIISGDLGKCVYKDKILEKSLNTKIFFSGIPGIEIPPLQRFEGFFMSKKAQGVTKIEL